MSRESVEAGLIAVQGTLPANHDRPSPSRTSTSSTSSLPIKDSPIGGYLLSNNGSNDRLPSGSPVTIMRSSTASSSRSSLLATASDSAGPDAAMPQTQAASASAEASGTQTPEADVQILEALRSKDRLFVLKLGEQMEALIRERGARLSFKISPENQYQRLLVHRCAQYYRMSPENDPLARDRTGNRDMLVVILAESVVPRIRISDLVPAEQTPLPMFKIMRRSELERRRQRSTFSRPGSTAGEDGELSDPEPSETGSMGSRSTTSKKHMTIAEREAAYEAARTRIFMNFDEKEKAKDRDTSASSSTFSLVSASGSGSQSGGAGCSSDIEDNASTAPTESEWSVPGTDRRRGGDPPDIPRTFPINPDAHTDSASPSLTFPSLYDPTALSQPQAPYEQHAAYPPPNAYMTGGYPLYPYPSHPQTTAQMGAPQPYMPYQFFPQYPYTAQPQPQFSNSESGSPATGLAQPYHQMSPLGSVAYAAPAQYGWMPQMQRQNSTDSQHSSAPTQTPPAQHAPMMMQPQYPQYIAPPGAVPYPMYPAQYFQPPQPGHPPMMMQAPYAMDQLPSNGSSSGISSHTGSPSPTLSRGANSSGSSSSGNHHPGSGTFRRGGPPSGAGRGAWSYSPSLGSSSPVIRGGPSPAEAVGPRLTSSLRRTSVGSGGGSHRTSGDDTISVASSSSSTNRKAVMATPPKHPLPARPDWAAGIKAQPTLHPTTRHRNDSNNSRTMSPAKPNQNLHQAQSHPTSSQNQHHHQRPPPVTFHSNDFPPLSGMPGTSGRPATGGVWGSSSNAIQTIGPTGCVQGEIALSNHHNPSAGSRLDDDDRSFERPPPKTSAELFNPKGGLKRPGAPSHVGSQPSSSRPSPHSQVQMRPPVHMVPASEQEQRRESERVKEVVASAILIERAAMMNIQSEAEAGVASKKAEDHEGTPKADSILSQVQA